MEFEKLILERKSTRNFTDEIINTEIIYKIIEDAIQAPTSCNLQHFSFILIDDLALINQLSKEVSYKFNYCKNFVLLIKQKDLSIKRGAGYTSAGFIADHLILSATNRGLDTLVMAGFEKDRKLKKLLRIPSNHEILLLIALGKSADINLVKPARIHVNRWIGLNTFNSRNMLKTKKNPSKWTWQEVIDYRMRIGQVYVDRFRLNTLPIEAYQIVLKNHSYKLVTPGEKFKILDLVSYDGLWAKLVLEEIERNRSASEIFLSDFSEQILASLKRNLKTNTILLTSFDPNEVKIKFDFLTSIFQLNHFVNIDEQLKFCKEVLALNGILLLAIYNDTKIKYILRNLVIFIDRFQMKPINVYENNIYYKSGPYKKLSRWYLARKLKSLGFFVLSVNRYSIGKGFKKYTVTVLEAQKLDLHRLPHELKSE